MSLAATAPKKGSLSRVPIWLLVLALGMTVAFVTAWLDPGMRSTLAVLRNGVAITIRITLVGFALAMALGVAAGLARTSDNRLAREAATLYVEVVRGIPLLVLILWVGFGFTPWLLASVLQVVANLAESGAASTIMQPVADFLAPCSQPRRCVPLEVRGVVGLAVGYGAYLAEIVRAGIESVSTGQREAALSLGMTRWQMVRLVVLPQALKVALPPLGNDFIAMLKDRSLVSVLAVPELLQQARFHISRTFQPFEVFNLVALTYLLMTTVLSAGVRYLEKRMQTGD